MSAYLEFEVSLLDIEPRIWRRFQLDATDTFGEMHQAIQDSFDWDGDHMWDFCTTGRDRRVLAGPGAYDLGYETDEIPDAWSVKLTQHFRRVSMTCRYTYDFGDSWVHAVTLRQRVTSAERFQRRLVAGCARRRTGPRPGSVADYAPGSIVEPNVERALLAITVPASTGTLSWATVGPRICRECRSQLG